MNTPHPPSSEGAEKKTTEKAVETGQTKKQKR